MDLTNSTSFNAFNRSKLQVNEESRKCEVPRGQIED